MITAIDLCSGGGGWATAARGTSVKIVAAYDFWSVACKTYELNHPGVQVHCVDLRDKKVHRELLKRHAGVDLVLGGIPCEWLSVYRNLTKVTKLELEDQQALLDSVLAMVKKLDPRYCCLEDVKGLVRQLPPLTPWTELDAQHWSAQRRKRVFVGYFPPPSPSRCARLLGDHLRAGPFRIGPRGINREPVRRNTFTKAHAHGAWRNLKAPTVTALTSRRDAELLVVDPEVTAIGKRQLEWQEMAALQGFPQDYLFYGSPTDVATMIGRAVQIDLGRAILESISADWLKSHTPKRPAHARR